MASLAAKDGAGAYKSSNSSYVRDVNMDEGMA